MHHLIPLVLQALTSVEEGKSIRVALRHTVESYNPTKEDESLVYYYVFEIYRRLNLIDLYIKTSSSSFSFRKIHSTRKSTLRLATYLLKIEDRQVSNVYNLLSDYFSQIDKLEFLPILQSIEEIKEKQLFENREDKASVLSLKFFLPTWIIRKFISQWDLKFTQDLIQSFQNPLPLYVRVNTLKTSMEEVKTSFTKKRIAYEEVKQIKSLLQIIETPIPIPRTSEYINGEVVIQQKSSAAVSLILNPQKDERILDMCASPGGKTAHIAALLQESDQITAVDLNDERMRILRNRLELLNVKNIELLQTDARKLHIEQLNRSYDKILVDPPCSGSGTYSSRPENRWRLKQRDLRWYVNLQRDLLQEAALMVKKGGSIVYSTCSLFHDENSEIINSFLEKNKGFYLDEQSIIIGVQKETEYGIVQEVFPHIHDTEGFFIAKLKRNIS